MIEEYNSIYDDTDCEPITLTKKEIQNLLIDSGVPEEITTKIEKSYVETFGDDLPLVENLIDAKALKANEQRRKEERLEKQVEILQTKLDQVKQEVSVDNETHLSTEVNDDNEALETNLEESQDTNSEDNNTTPDYDVILQVKPEKIPQIKSQIIDGQKCIVIPINEDEQTTVNGLDDLI
jgi:ABC-type proline/glycine betaine transport system ATPase subunit